MDRFAGSVIVQIYEIQQPHEAEQLIDLGVDHVGSVIASQREWKDPLIKETVRICQSALRRSSIIPLFSRFDAICRVIEYYRPDIIHFCESLSHHTGAHDNCQQWVKMQADIKAAFPQIDIMRSIPIAQSGFAQYVPTLELAKMFEPYSDFFLTDTFIINGQSQLEVEQPVGGFIGITGKTCDWSMAQELVLTSQIPVILAGGITPDNVARGIAQVQPAGVDSCTGTNRLDEQHIPVRFKKDMVKVAQLVTAARRAEGQMINMSKGGMISDVGKR